MIKLISYVAIVSLFSYTVSSFTAFIDQQATEDKNELKGNDSLIVDVFKPLNTSLHKKKNKTLQYCPLDESVKKSIRNILRDIGRILRSAYRQKFWKRYEERNHNVQRSRRQIVPWPFNCGHASLMFHEGQLTINLPSQKCCKECEFPGFTRCVANNNGVDVCTEQGLQCVNACVEKYVRRCTSPISPAALSKIVTIQSLSQSNRVDNKVQQICPTRKKTMGQLYCLERSCIPLNI